MHHRFDPLYFLKNGTAQTIASLYWPQVGAVSGLQTRHHVSINPFGALAIVENRPSNWRVGDRIVLLVHGLTGSENSNHLVRLAHAFVNRGVMAIRMNMRGCGAGEGLASGIYHSGRSEDTRAVLEWIGLRYPSSRVTQIGISLGGNATLKMAGEYGSDRPSFLESVVAVSTPIDLSACSERISQRRNLIFDRYFSSKLLRHVELLHRKFPDKVPPFPKHIRSRGLSLAEFDDIYTGPVSGFRNAQHYYKSCSSGPLIPKIDCGVLMITAEDDPIITPESYRRLTLASHHRLVMTPHGGHAAWLGKKIDDDFGHFWMDRLVVGWVLNN